MPGIKYHQYCNKSYGRDQMTGMKERRILYFNDAFNTFHLQLYGISYMVEDHSNRDGVNPLPPLYGLFFYMHHPIYWTAITAAFDIPVVGHWLGHKNNGFTDI